MPDNAKESDYVLVQGGTFTMGDTFGGGEKNEKPTHNVTLYSFYMSRYKYTNLNSDRAEITTWYDAVMLANKLSEKEGLPPYYYIKVWMADVNGWDGRIDYSYQTGKVEILGGVGYRLPTEAEWEYAARGGNKSKGYKYSGSNNLDEVASNEEGYSRNFVIGQKKANELGIYDMNGGPMEWCWDLYEAYTTPSKINPRGYYSNKGMVMRGGGIAKRSYLPPSERSNGFRLVRSHEDHAYNKGFWCKNVFCVI